MIAMHAIVLVVDTYSSPRRHVDLKWLHLAKQWFDYEGNFACACAGTSEERHRVLCRGWAVGCICIVCACVCVWHIRLGLRLELLTF